jgi:hypothetical protein
MLYAVIKALLSGVVIAAASEAAKRSPAMGAVILSLPLISILAFIWLWRDTSDTGAIAALSQSTFWFVLPTLPMFLVLPALLRNGAGFWPALWLVLPYDAFALCRDGVDARETRHLLVTGDRDFAGTGTGAGTKPDMRAFIRRFAFGGFPQKWTAISTSIRCGRTGAPKASLAQPLIPSSGTASFSASQPRSARRPSATG